MKNYYNISDLARSLNVNRRTLYNWFNQEKIKKNIILRIGCIIRHDFSHQFPEMFTSEEFKEINILMKQQLMGDKKNQWRTKYLLLLQEYNKVADMHLTIV